MPRGIRIGYPRAVRISGDTVNYALTGNAAGLLAARTIPAAQGAYAVAGQEAALTPVFLSGGIDALTITTETATPEQIGLYLIPTRTIAAGSTVTARYRTTAGPGAWNTAHQLLRISPTGNQAGGPTTIIDSFAGSIFDLTAGTQYDVELTHVESGQSTKTTTIQRTTRALPAAAGAVTVTATTADSLQTKFNALAAGAVLELATGTYTVAGLTLNNSGTSGSPIYIRGASRTGVIIKDTTGDVLRMENCSHVVIENLTIEGSRVDSGTAASSTGIQFGVSVANTNITIRTVDIVGVDVGIKANTAKSGILVYDCDMRGNNVWNSTNTDTNATWNDDGLCLPGQGNCAWNNYLEGFGDSFAVIQDELSAGVYYYRNKVQRTGDDTFEGDYSTRNIGFYDNYITNCATLLSLDPLYGGPLYCFRNIAINCWRQPFKLNAANTGHLIYNNTVLRGDSESFRTPGFGWIQDSNGTQGNWAYRNNLLIHRFSVDRWTLFFDAAISTVDWTNNAWYPGTREMQIRAEYFATMAAAIADSNPGGASSPVFSSATRLMLNDVVTTSAPWDNTITLGATYGTEVTTSAVPSIAAGNAAENTGIALAGITDGFTGAAPDMGAIIAGRAVPAWGCITSRTVPAWRSAATANQWNTLSSNTIGSKAPYLDGTANPNGAGNAPPWVPGGNSPAATLWANMVKSESLRQLFTSHIGGHSGYSGNEAYLLDMTAGSPAWSRVRDPTGSIANPGTTSHNSQGAYSDGQMGCFHQYGIGAWAPAGVVYPIMGAANNGTGSNIEHAYRVNPATGVSTYLGDTSAFCGTSNPGASCYDSSRDRVWHAHHASSQLLEINPNTGAFVGRGSTFDLWGSGEPFGLYIPGTYPAGDVFVIFCGSPEFVMFRLDTYANSQPSISGSYASGFRLSECGAAWDNVRKRIYLWNNSSNTKQISTLTPSDPNNLQAAWVRGSLSTPAGGVTPAAEPSGTYGRLQYFQDLDCLTLQTEFTNATLFYPLS